MQYKVWWKCLENNLLHLIMVNLFLQGTFWALSNSGEIAQFGKRQTEIFQKLFLEYLAAYYICCKCFFTKCQKIFETFRGGYGHRSRYLAYAKRALYETREIHDLSGTYKCQEMCMSHRNITWKPVLIEIWRIYKAAAVNRLKFIKI